MPKPKDISPNKKVVKREYKPNRPDIFGSYVKQRALELIENIEPNNTKMGIRPFRRIKQILACSFLMDKRTAWQLLLSMSRDNEPKIRIIPCHGIQIIGVSRNENPFYAERESHVAKAKRIREMH